MLRDYYDYDMHVMKNERANHHWVVHSENVRQCSKKKQIDKQTDIVNRCT